MCLLTIQVKTCRCVNIDVYRKLNQKYSKNILDDVEIIISLLKLNQACVEMQMCCFQVKVAFVHSLDNVTVYRPDMSHNLRFDLSKILQDMYHSKG